MLAAFVVVERRVATPLFDLSLFSIRPFAFGNTANLLASLGRGGLQFVLIIWLQGIWLPQHGYSSTETPLWAGIDMLPDALSSGLTAHGVPAADQADYLTGRSFFPQHITGPFAHGRTAAFWFAIVACLVAAAASWFSGARRPPPAAHGRHRA